MAWQLMLRDQRVLVVDRDEPETSSKVAAGLVTPIAGGRFNTAEDLEETLPFAKKFYWDLEETLGSIFFNHLRTAKLFQDDKERSLWKKKEQESPESLSEYFCPLDIDKSLFKADKGGFEMIGGGWLNLPGFLEAIRQYLLERASYAIGKIDIEEIKLCTNGVRWKNIHAEKGVIFCQGWRGDQNRFFDWVPMNPAHGEILNIRCDQAADETRIVKKSGWMVPLGGGEFRVGSNYDHQFTSSGPTEAGLETVKEKIRNIVNVPFSVTRHRAAVRPIIRRSRIVMGRHPGHKQVAFFNGLGSKGVLNGPYYSNLLSSHLLEETAIPDDMNIRKNF